MIWWKDYKDKLNLNYHYKDKLKISEGKLWKHKPILIQAVLLITILLLIDKIPMF